MTDKPLYQVTRNSDLTEGKGHQMTVMYTYDLDEAVAEAKKWGVQRVGTGDIYLVNIGVAPDRDNPLNKVEIETHIWGYRKKNGRWGYGWIDEKYNPKPDKATRIHEVLMQYSHPSQQNAVLEAIRNIEDEDD